ncbi:MAG: tripartite tricarboxylate transporter TctB family protein [Planctomycetes bacterium]|nr:tripartite tricarboxylate transporter TctB family protein [Planctomycetota bacterium]
MAIMMVIIGLGAAVFGYSLTFPGADHFRSGNWVPGPAFFPRLLTVLLILVTGVELVREIRKRTLRKSEAASAAGGAFPPAAKNSFREWARDWGTQNALILLALMFAFPLLLDSIGFAILGFVMVFTIAWRLKAGALKSAVFAAFTVTLTMFFFKYVFYLDFPPGLWSPTMMF